MVHLGFVLIIANLGASCLLGEPAKKRNNIICLPKQKLVLLANGDEMQYAPYDTGNSKHSLVRALTNQAIAPGGQYTYALPDCFAYDDSVCVTPRSSSIEWLQPGTLTPSNGKIHLVNSSDKYVHLSKADHIADVRDVTIPDIPIKPISGRFAHDDKFQFRDFAASREINEDYLRSIQLDPDNIMDSEQKNIFHTLHRRFMKLFTPQPGKYNGSRGYIDNQLQFSMPPPPNTRTKVPNYSPPMNDLLAQKMDTLEEWGVLVEPETMGVSVEFISPSMLVPKTEKNEYRVVTDFSALNVFLKKIPNTSATIAQAKARIARAQYVIHLDLSNYFFQCGLQKNDIKYLGTIHPYKGLRVYTVDPQGLKGASERSYEKLVRIFGDMVQERKLAQMADGLHVLGNSITELAANYTEVLTRAEQCNLTFKPSKVVICPRTITLFGWQLRDHVWLPTEHTTSALVNATEPVTVKQMRSFLGSFKQLSSSLPGYAATIHCLEQLVGGRASREKINWTESLRSAFLKAKQLAGHPYGIAEPRPEDQLYTYSDYSAEARAVGGRLVINRKQPDGQIVQLNGGFFSVVLDKHKQNWLPCEGEACGIRLVLEHFKNQIKESEHTTTHFTDSQPCVLAWKRSKRGAFSSSSRIAAFLTGLSVLPVQLQHKAGKDMFTSDYASRHPKPCEQTRCQICRFANDWQLIGDNALNIRSIKLDDIQSGKSIMPFIQEKVWKIIQSKDPTHCRLKHLIDTRQLPETKKTKGEHTKLKLLHNLYTQGKLYIDHGLIRVKSPDVEISTDAISVPSSIFPGVLNALHIRLDHPSKAQLTRLVSRYFYSPGWRALIDEITDNCHQCAATKTLPKVLTEDSTTLPDNIGSNFAADVMEREGQKILIVRECMSQFTRAKLIQDQKADTLRRALLSLILDIIPDSGTVVRVDGATSFQSLEAESMMDNSPLKSLGVKIVVGRLLNKNKNPIAENAVKEVQKEILRLKNTIGPITEIELAIVTKNVNSRIRYNGLTPKEILYRRNTLTNLPIEVNDEEIIKKQLTNRQKSSQASFKHKGKSKKPTPEQTFKLGDLVLLRDHKSKNSPRSLYIVDSLPSEETDWYILIRKLGQSLRSRVYKAKPEELIHSPNTPLTPKRTLRRENQPREAAIKARVKMQSSISKVENHNLKSKYGWKEEDQFDDLDFIRPIPDTNISPNSSYSCNMTTPSPTRTSTPENTESIQSDDSYDDLFWDTSPAQYLLQSRPQETPEDPLMSLQLQPPEDNYPSTSTPHTRSRTLAISAPTLRRTNAFRSPHPDHAFIRTPSPTQEENPIVMAPRKSRIPKPFSPSQVQMHAVNDLSHLPHVSNLNTPLRRSSRIKSRTFYRRGTTTTNSYQQRQIPQTIDEAQHSNEVEATRQEDNQWNVAQKDAERHQDNEDQRKIRNQETSQPEPQRNKKKKKEKETLRKHGL